MPDTDDIIGTMPNSSAAEWLRGKALTNARSVTGRLFTKEECADHHCQVGNMGLLMKTILDWIGEKTDGEKTGTDGRQKG